MNQKEFLSLLKKYLNKEVRQIVREEIEYSLKKELRSIIREEIEFLKTGVSLTEVIDNEEEETSISYESLVPKREKSEPVVYSKNPLLNELLEQTADEMPREKSGKSPSMTLKEEYKNIGNFTSKSVQPNVKPKLSEIRPAVKIEEDRGIEDVREILPDDRKHRDIPDFLQNVFTRDYSELTKAMSNTKKGSSGPLPGMPPM